MSAWIQMISDEEADAERRTRDAREVLHHADGVALRTREAFDLLEP